MLRHKRFAIDVRLAVFGVGVWLLLFGLDVSGFTQALQSRLSPRLMRSVAHWHFGLVSQAKKFEAVSRLFTRVQAVWQLEQEYQALQAKLADLQQVESRYQALIEQSSASASQSQLSHAKAWSVPIVSYPYRMIEVGSKHQIQVGDLVFVNDLLVGRVSQVWTTTAQVNLFSQQQNEPLLVKTQTGVKGLVRLDAGEFVLTEIDRQSPVIEGERVVTMGQPGIPAGLLLGFVAQDLSKVEDSVLTYQIAIPRSFDQASMVTIR